MSARRWPGGARQREVRDHEQVEDVLPVHEDELPSLRGVDLLADPVPGRLRNLTASDDERMVHQDALADLGIKDHVVEHHQNLIADLRDVGIAALAGSGSVDLPLLGLNTEIQHVGRRQRELHPHILALLQGLVLVPGVRDPEKAELPEQRQQDLLDQLILRR